MQQKLNVRSARIKGTWNSNYIFKQVNYKVNESLNTNKTIDVTIEEKPTGEIFAGAGTGTSGSSLTAGIKENNYLGLGIKLDTNFVLTDETLKGKFSVINPNYNNSDKSIKTEIESSTSDFISTSGYKSSRTGLTIGTEFEQFKDFFVNLQITWKLIIIIFVLEVIPPDI